MNNVQSPRSDDSGIEAEILAKGKTAARPDAMSCPDCRAAACRPWKWPFYTATCQGCMDRALSELKTLPPLEPAAENGKEKPCSD